MKIGMLAAVAALALSSPVMAGDWRVTGSNDQTIKGFDIDSLVITGTKRTVWEIMVFSEISEGVDYFMSRTEYDCSGNRYRDLALAAYTLDGRSTNPLSASMRWVDIFPDTIAHEAVEIVCGRQSAEPVNIETSRSFALIARSVLAEKN